jgi:hypothetical protein
MSGTNGELHPTSEPPALSTPGKRKRANLEASSRNAGASAQTQEKSRLHEALRNLVDILEKSVPSS